MKRLLSVFLTISMVLILVPAYVSAEENTNEGYVTSQINDLKFGENVIYDDGNTKISVTVLDFRPTNPDGSPMIVPMYSYDQGVGEWSGNPPAGNYDIRVSKSSAMYTASFLANCDFNNSNRGINYITEPTLDGPFFSHTFTQFEVLKAKPNNGTPALAAMCWDATLGDFYGISFINMSGYLKMEMDGFAYRILWKI